MIVPGSGNPSVSSPARNAEITAQVERLVGSTAFRNSKRYTSLLRHLVSRTLEGREAELKERLIAIEVFGRPADYDSNSDPVVRTSAGELRRRIAQYYHEEGRETEIRISLPVGSYVPEFQIPALAANPGPAKAQRSRYVRLRVAAAAAAIGLVAVAAVLWTSRPNDFDRFWSPVLNSRVPVSLCVALAEDPPWAQPQPGSAGGAKHAPLVAYADLTAVSNLAGLLEARKQKFQLQRDDRTTLEDLRRGPAIMVGAFNDIWTLRVTNDLRFSFQRDGERCWVQDSRNPSSRAWVVGRGNGDGRANLTRDYAVISRVLKARTGQPVITVAGTYGFGTEIASEYITKPDFVSMIASRAPSGWEKMNAQIVISTEVIDDHAGPPRILATHFWR